MAVLARIFFAIGHERTSTIYTHVEVLIAVGLHLSFILLIEIVGLFDLLLILLIRNKLLLEILILLVVILVIPYIFW